MSYEGKRPGMRLIALVAVLLGMAVAIGACGSDHNSHSAPAAPITPATPTPMPTPTPLPPTACLPSSSLSVLVQGSNVLSYVPKGNWLGGTAGLSLVQIEGTGVTPTLISTPNIVNSCSSDSATGETVCTANNTDVYLIKGSTLVNTLTSSATGTISFSGGSCTNCGVVVNDATDQALITLSTASGPGFQFLDLGGSTPAFEPAFSSQSSPQAVSEDVVIDPERHLMLSPTEKSVYEVINIATTTSPQFFENDTSSNSSLSGTYDSAGEDCTTGVALATDEGTGNIFLADLNQATLTPGSPGTWTAPEQRQHFPEFASLSAGTNAIAVAGDSHIAVVNGEFGGNLIGAINLPTTAGSGGAIPAASDYIVCTIPETPNHVTWDTGFDPHTTTAYVSPNTGDAMALVTNSGASYVAVIDMTKLLDPTIVPRINNGFPSAHTCSSSVNLVSAGVVRFVPVP